MKKVLLIIEAGSNREYAFKALKDCNLFKIILMTRKESLYGYEKWVDECIQVDTNNYEELKNKVIALKDYNIDGVMTLLEWYVPITEKIKEEFGFIGNSYKTAIRARNKYSMRKALQEHGLKTPAFFKCTNFEEVQAAFRSLKDPSCIIKPIEDTGSTNVKRVSNDKELLEAYNEIIRKDLNSRGQLLSKDVLIEEFLDGQEYSVDSLTIDGKTEVLAINDYITTKGPHFVELGLSTPSMLSNEIQAQLKETAIMAINAIGIKNGPSHCEIKLTLRGPIVIEIGARHGGGYIPELIKLTTGFDFYVQTALVFCKEQIEINISHITAAATRKIYAKNSGVIKSIKNTQIARKMKGCNEIIIKSKVNDFIDKEIKDYSSFAGYVITTADSPIEAIHCAEAIRETIEIDVS